MENHAGLMAITPDGMRAYVTAPASIAIYNRVFVIDTASNTVTATISVAAQPAGIVITPDGAHAYVTSDFFNIVSVIDTASNTVTATIPVQSNPEGIAITSDGARAYVANSFSNTVSVIDTTTNTALGTPITVGSLPVALAITPVTAAPVSAFKATLGIQFWQEAQHRCL